MDANITAKKLGLEEDDSSSDIKFISKNEDYPVSLKIEKISYDHPIETDWSKYYDKETYDYMLQVQTESIKNTLSRLNEVELKEITCTNTIRINFRYATYMAYSLLYKDLSKTVSCQQYAIYTNTDAYNLYITYEDELSDSWKNDLSNCVQTFTITETTDSVP